MPPKKSKRQNVHPVDTYFLVRNDENSCCYVLGKNQLNFSRKDGLKIGSHVRFNGTNGSSSASAGIIVMTGSKDQCEASLAVIEKANNLTKDRLDDADSDESNGLSIVDHEGEESDSQSNNIRYVNNDETRTVDMVRKSCTKTSNKNDRTTTSPTSNSTDESSSSTVPSTTTSPSTTVLKVVNQNCDVSNVCEETPDEYVVVVEKQKKRKKISAIEYENLQRRVKQLEKINDSYKHHWMPRPNPNAAAYFVEVGKVLSGDAETMSGDEKSTKLERLCEILNMTEKELQDCEHKTDITKTCRQITRFIYPDIDKRAQLLVSTMDDVQLRAIHEYARMVHPAQSSLPKSILNNAIGNVFATEKRKRDQVESEDESD